MQNKNSVKHKKQTNILIPKRVMNIFRINYFFMLAVRYGNKKC